MQIISTFKNLDIVIIISILYAMPKNAYHITKLFNFILLGSTPSPCEKEQVKKRDKRLFNTAGKKAGAKLRNKLGISKVVDDQSSDFSKPGSPKDSSLPPSPNDDDIVQGKVCVIDILGPGLVGGLE